MSPPCSTTSAVPTCLWGTCVNSTTCQCFEGYEHDMILMKYENCGLLKVGLDVYGGVALAACIVGALVNVYVGRSTLRGSLLRRLSVSATIANVAFAATLADLLHFKYITAQALVFYVVALFGVCYSFAYLFLSVLLPVSKISRAIAAKFIPWRRFWLLFIPLCCGIGAAITFLGAFVFTNPSDKRQVNSWLIGQALLFMALVAIAVPAFTSFTGILIKGLEQALDLANRMDMDESSSTAAKGTPMLNTNSPPPSRKSSTNDPDFGAATLQRQQLVKDLLRRVLFIRKAVLFAGFALFALSTSGFVLQTVTGTVPLFWAILVSGPIGMALFTMQMAYYTRKKREAERRRSNFVPFVAEFGRQISGGLRRTASRKRLSWFGSSRNGSNADQVDETGAAGAGAGSNRDLYMRNNNVVEVPSTVKEEPSHMVGSWAEPVPIGPRAGSSTIQQGHFDIPATMVREPSGEGSMQRSISKRSATSNGRNTKLSFKEEQLDV